MKRLQQPVVKSAIRAIDVLEFISGADRPPSFAEIGTALEIPNSSLFYLLNTLSQRGYLQQNAAKNGGYILGPSLITLANSVSRLSVTQVLEPVLNAAWEEVRETTSYFERRGDEMECVACQLAEHPLISVHRVGQRTPLYPFSGGKICLAEMKNDEFEAYLARTDLRQWTEHTLTNADELRRDVAKTRKTGIGVSRQEYTMGVVGVSIGMRNSNRLVGSLGIAVPAVRFNEEMFKRMVETLKHSALRFAQATAGEVVAAGEPLRASS